MIQNRKRKLDEILSHLKRKEDVGNSELISIIWRQVHVNQEESTL